MTLGIANRAKCENDRAHQTSHAVGEQKNENDLAVLREILAPEAEHQMNRKD
jgi:hypothetical protein